MHKKTRPNFPLTAAIAVLTFLASCGGGGDGEALTPDPNDGGDAARVDWDELVWDDDSWS